MPCGFSAGFSWMRDHDPYSQRTGLRLASSRAGNRPRPGKEAMIVLAAERILITGSTGWLGLNLVQALAHGLPDSPAVATGGNGLKLRCLVGPGQDAEPLRRIAPDVDAITGDLRRFADCQRF